MIQAVIGGLILLGVYKYMKSGSEYDVDWWMAGTFIFVPAVLISLLQLALAFFELNLAFALLGYCLYFIIPFLMLNKGLDFEAKIAAKFAGVVPIIAIMTEIPFLFLANPT